MSYGLTVADLWDPKEGIQEGDRVYYFMDTPVANYAQITLGAEDVVDKMGPFKTMTDAVRAAQKRMAATKMGTHILVERYGRKQ